MAFGRGGLIAAFALLWVAGLPVASAQTPPLEVDVRVSVVGFGSYDAKQGSYTLDFYLLLSWDSADEPEGFQPEQFEFANGRATNRDLQFNETDEAGRRSLFYRIQANLNSEPRYDDYPFDEQLVEVRLEHKIRTRAELVYVPDPASGLEDDFQPAGWLVSDVRFVEEANYLRFEDDVYSQARFTIALERSVLSSVLKVIIPPLAFVAISGVAFFLVGADKVATRFALTGNMAITGVMFHAAQSASLPSLPGLIFLDRYMLSILVFLFGSVLVTALVALADMKWKDPERAKRISLRGAIAVPAAAVGAFFLLLLV